jgi:hypothetical protein
MHASERLSTKDLTREALRPMDETLAGYAGSRG